MSQSEVTIVRGEGELIDRVQPLWLELQQHHAGINQLWRAQVLAATFERRADGLLRKAVNGCLVLVATAAGHDLGYCICTVDEQRQGEVDSIYVATDFRGRGIGHKLLREAMQWLAGRQASSIVVEVLSGNEGAMRLYQEFGFYPRTVLLRHVPESDSVPAAD